MDSYRPGDNQRPGYRDAADSYRPQHYDHAPPLPPPWAPLVPGNGMYHFQGSRNREPPREFTYRPRPPTQNGRLLPLRHEQQRRFPPPPPRTAANRPLFNLRHNEIADFAFTNGNSEPKFSFRNLNELTDSEEEEMAQLDDEQPTHRANKRARLSKIESDAAPALPKWSNPDPYTSLPPAADATAKRTDVVKLIRKARVDTLNGLQKVNKADDFISFEGAEPDSSEESAHSSLPSPNAPPLAAPVAPRAESKNMATGKRKRGLELGDEAPLPRSDNQIYADQLVQDKWIAAPGIPTTPWLKAHPPSDIASTL